MNMPYSLMKGHQMKINTCIKTIFAVGTILLLTACQKDFALLNNEKAHVGKVTLEIDANFPSPVRATVNEKEFSGNWRAAKVYEAGLEKKYRLLGGAAYGNYKVGNARDQLYKGRANLTTRDGTEMTCDFYYRAQPISGHCRVDGNILELTLSD